MSPASSASVRNTFRIGTHAYDKYCEKRLVSGKHSMYHTIPLFSQKNVLTIPKSKLKLLSLKSDCQLHASLYIALQARQADLHEIFALKNYAYPVSISGYGKLSKTQIRVPALLARYTGANL